MITLMIVLCGLPALADAAVATGSIAVMTSVVPERAGAGEPVRQLARVTNTGTELAVLLVVEMSAGCRYIVAALPPGQGTGVSCAAVARPGGVWTVTVRGRTQRGEPLHAQASTTTPGPAEPASPAPSPRMASPPAISPPASSSPPAVAQPTQSHEPSPRSARASPPEEPRQAPARQPAARVPAPAPAPPGSAGPWPAQPPAQAPAPHPAVGPPPGPALAAPEPGRPVPPPAAAPLVPAQEPRLAIGEPVEGEAALPPTASEKRGPLGSPIRTAAVVAALAVLAMSATAGALSSATRIR